MLLEFKKTSSHRLLYFIFGNSFQSFKWSKGPCPILEKKITPTPNYVYNTTVVVRTFLESRSYRWLTKLDGKVNISSTVNHSSLEVGSPTYILKTWVWVHNHTIQHEWLSVFCYLLVLWFLLPKIRTHGFEETSIDSCTMRPNQ